jgi:hypothetical protein
LFVTEKFNSLTASKPRRNDASLRLESAMRKWYHSVCELLLRATKPVSMPILIAPTALPGLAHPEGSRHDQGGWRCQDRDDFGDPFDVLDRGSCGGGHRSRLVPALRA